MKSICTGISLAVAVVTSVATITVAAQAAAMGATVILSNHSEFDNAVSKNRMLAGRGDGPHPYEVGAEWVARYFQVNAGLRQSGAAQAGAGTGERGWTVG
jgi:hypothetical protein